ncbi:unnamed protein product [Dibothriocephalus latus]|uniref:Uncharacterized protein n=1 Tax=Dibothriocephalus latus TaxID=60516 RepID=A0A3P7LMQ1_DIBLA|nr:unnamed protein product [Dibothriocephalus latus]
MSAKHRFQQGSFDTLLEDLQILSDASFISDEGEKRTPSPPAKNTLGKQVRFNSAIAIASARFGVSSPEQQESSINTVPVADNRQVTSCPLQPSVSVFVDLLEVSVSESEIVREEKEKVANRRRQLMAALKKSAIEEPLPEPCPMKFFDLQQHVFQSARLHITGIPNLLPELNGLSDDQVTEIGNDYRRSLPSYYL